MEMGVIVVLFVLVFYVCFNMLDDMIDYIFGCVFDLFGLDVGIVLCWGEEVLFV